MSPRRYLYITLSWRERDRRLTKANPQRNEEGNNVTFSPRYSRGDYEPTYYPQFEYLTLPGTGITDDHLVFSAHCLSGCRSWPGGYMDINDNNQKGIYALGPRESLRSNDPAAPIKYHSRYGSFGIQMGQTLGHADAPELSDKSENQFTEQHEQKSGKFDAKSTFHAVAMILVFIVLLPIGVFVLRVANSVKGHAAIQGISLLGALGGLGLGVITSFHYQRVSGIQLIPEKYSLLFGLLTSFASRGNSSRPTKSSASSSLPASLDNCKPYCSHSLSPDIRMLTSLSVIGVMHHLRFKKRQVAGKLRPVHLWLGRIVILLGAVDAFMYAACPSLTLSLPPLRTA